MRTQILIGACCFVLQGVAFSKMVVDLYGDDSAVGKRVLSAYQIQVTRLEEKRLQLESKYQNHIPQRLIKPILRQRQLLCEQIKNTGGYVYANYDAVYYPTDRQHYVTIEVVTAKERDRLKWISPPLAYHPQQIIKHDVITLMQDYLDKGVQLMLSHQLKPTPPKCPGFHCLFGFDHPLLKPYRQKFDQGVQAQQSFIATTLAHDPDPERRIAAAYLIGEFHDPKQILNLLTKHVTDTNNGVRNAVVRVIAQTMHQSGLNKINVLPFVELINSPDESDRNKALFVLLEAAEVPQQKRIINQRASKIIRQLARLKQPNNHAFANLLLNKL
jgi:hypothetical protein